MSGEEGDARETENPARRLSVSQRPSSTIIADRVQATTEGKKYFYDR